MVGTVRPVEAVLGEYGPDMGEGQGGLTRVVFLEQPGQEWRLAIPDVHARQQADPPARVAEVGCGLGWATIGLARLPRVRVDRYDLDAPWVGLAEASARAVGVGDRVSFEVRDAAGAATGATYDLELAFECIHDLAAPVGALRAVRALAGERGAGRRHGRAGR